MPSVADPLLLLGGHQHSALAPLDYYPVTVNERDDASTIRSLGKAQSCHVKRELQDQRDLDFLLLDISTASPPYCRVSA